MDGRSGIDVLCYTNDNPNGLEYVEFQRRSLETFASGKHNINCKVILSYDAKKSPRGYEVVGYAKNYHPQISMQHGSALNEGLQYFQQDYCLIIDGDVAITYPGWDDLLVSMLGKYDFWGWEPPHGYKRGAPDFPVVFFCAFRKLVLEKCELDFRPILQQPEPIDKSEGRVQRVLVEDSEWVVAYDSIKNTPLKCDTGYKLPLIAHRASLTHATIPYVRQDYPNRLMPYKDDEQKELCLGWNGQKWKHKSHMSEWHYEGMLFGTHKQACRSHPLSTGIGAAWKWRVNEYCRKTWGKEIR